MESHVLKASCCVVVLIALALPGAASARGCDEMMADAHQRIADIKARDPKIDELFKKKDMAGVCKILRTNVSDMTSARDSMQACLSGFERNENVANLNANLADLSDAITTHCK